MVNYLRRAYKRLEDVGAWADDFWFAIKDTWNSLGEPEEPKPVFNEPTNVIRYWNRMMDGYYRERGIEIKKAGRSNGQEQESALEREVRSFVLGIINSYVAERSEKSEPVIEDDLYKLIRDILRNPGESIRKIEEGKIEGIDDYIDGMLAYERENSEQIIV